MQGGRCPSSQARTLAVLTFGDLRPTAYLSNFKRNVPSASSASSVSLKNRLTTQASPPVRTCPHLSARRGNKNTINNRKEFSGRDPPTWCAAAPHTVSNRWEDP